MFQLFDTFTALIKVKGTSRVYPVFLSVPGVYSLIQLTLSNPILNYCLPTYSSHNATIQTKFQLNQFQQYQKMRQVDRTDYPRIFGIEMKLEMLMVGPFEENCYLYWDEKSGKGVIVDPGDEAGRIIDTVLRAKFEPIAILLTHGHGDHIGALAEVKANWKLSVYIGKGEEGYLADPNLNGSAFFDFPIIAPQPDFIVEDENVYRFDSIDLRVLSTPGHTAAGVCYLDESEGVLFCGDTLFQGSIGRTDLLGGSYEKLIDSIQKKILPLPDDIVCLPGHGPATTVGAERTSNPFLIGKNRFA